MKAQTTARRACALLAASLSIALAFAGVRAFAQATTTTTNETVPITGTLPNPCNGDLVTFQGNSHVTNTFTTDSSGGTHLKTHINYQDVTGVGSPSGLNYRVGTVSNETVNDSDGPQSVATIISTVKLISQGPALNYFLRTVLHVTVNANGETTSTVEEVKIECRGQN